MYRHFVLAISVVTIAASGCSKAGVDNDADNAIGVAKDHSLESQSAGFVFGDDKRTATFVGGWDLTTKYSISADDVKKLLMEESLRALELPRSRIHGDIVMLIAKSKQLEWLNLSNSDIDNCDMKQIARMPSLRTLHITNTRVDDEGLRYFARHPALEEIHATGSTITKGGATWLKEQGGRLRYIDVIDNDMSGSSLQNDK